MYIEELPAKVKNPGVVLVAALCLVGLSQDPAFAQRTPTSLERRAEHLNRQAGEYERDKLNRDLKEGPGTPGDQKGIHAVAAQVRQDFEDLQANYNLIVLAMATKKDLDRNSVLAAVAEIKKCSTRLRSNLALSKPDDKKQKGVSAEIDNGRLEDSLLKLREHIYSFVTNPLFESRGVLDVPQAKKASVDLDRIIELSESIRKNGNNQKIPSNPR